MQWSSSVSTHSQHSIYCFFLLSIANTAYFIYTEPLNIYKPGKPSKTNISFSWMFVMHYCHNYIGNGHGKKAAKINKGTASSCLRTVYQRGQIEGNGIHQQSVSEEEQFILNGKYHRVRGRTQRKLIELLCNLQRAYAQKFLFLGGTWNEKLYS